MSIIDKIFMISFILLPLAVILTPSKERKYNKFEECWAMIGLTTFFYIVGYIIWKVMKI